MSFWWVKVFVKLFENIHFTKLTFAKILLRFKAFILFIRKFTKGFPLSFAFGKLSPLSLK